ncbi:MAG: hypothetical protein NE334_16460 [Lentisphaeraceae bacterium]|nr:hypothetical protein [Lentisphaeraceae bacterium]
MKVFLVLFSLSLACFAATPEGYRIETIETPQNVFFHIAGLDITKDGSIYCCTRYGDVWILKKGVWSKFASGLQEPCGLVVDKDGSVIVTQKAEMTKLVDSDKDGQADLFLNLTNAFEFHNNYHEFNFGGVIDNDGNYIGTLNLAAGRNVPGLRISTMATEGGYRGWAYKVSPSGKFTPFASGLRSPAGVGKNNLGELFFTDNQGDFVPTSTLNHLEDGKFYGHPISLLDKPEFSAKKIENMSDEEFDKLRTLPVVWIPQEEVANSPGNPEWNATKGKFGPFDDQFFIGDQTRSNIFRVSLQKVGERYQGCVIDFMSGLQSGNIRLKFGPDGALWAGQTNRGWGSRGSKSFGLQKVVWDGTTVPFEIQDIKLISDGFKVTFTQALDSGSISKESIGMSQWWYKYSRAYGSPKIGLQLPKIDSLRLSKDGKVLTVKLPLQKEQVYCLDFREVISQHGKALQNYKAYYTLVNLIDE